MEKHRGRRVRGSILDLFLIFLFFLSILGIALRWHELHGSTWGEQWEEFRMYAELTAIDPRIADCIAEGDILYTASGETFGRIVRAEQTPSEVTLISNGAPFVGAWDQTRKCNLLLEISFEGRTSGQGVLWHGTHTVLSGESRLLYTDRATLHLKTLKTEPFKG